VNVDPAGRRSTSEQGNRHPEEIMTTMTHTVVTPTATASKKAILAGRIIIALVALFMLFDSVIHLLKIAVVVDAFNHLGYPLSVVTGLALLELACVVVYVIPRTSVLGAILLTGYFGGAVATHVRVGSSLFGEILFPVYMGVLVWGALFLIDERLRALIPLRSSAR
jgi:hypothetical protein